MGFTVRAAGTVAHTPTRLLPNGIGSSAPSPITDQTQAHGVSGSEDCVLTVAVDPTVSGNTTITCYIWCNIFGTGKWIKAGGNSGVYEKVWEPGCSDVFVVPESTPFFLVGSQAIASPLIAVDGIAPSTTGF